MLADASDEPADSTVLDGFGDRAGSGIPRIYQAWYEQHWRTPDLVEDFEANETCRELSMESLLPDYVLEDLERRFGARFRALPEAKRTALITAAAEGKITNRRLQGVLDHHPRDLTFLLGDLVRDGFVNPHGERSGRWYTLAEPRHPEGPPSSSQSSEQSGPNSEQSSTQSSTQSSPNLEQAPLAATLFGESDRVDLAEKVRSSKWVEREVAEAAILEICMDRFVDLQELSSRLGRAPKTLRAYLKPLVRRGQLELKYPEQPTHPLQAYRTVTEIPNE